MYPNIDLSTAIREHWMRTEDGRRHIHPRLQEWWPRLKPYWLHGGLVESTPIEVKADAVAELLDPDTLPHSPKQRQLRKDVATAIADVADKTGKEDFLRSHDWDLMQQDKAAVGVLLTGPGPHWLPTASDMENSIEVLAGILTRLQVKHRDQINAEAIKPVPVPVPEASSEPVATTKKASPPPKYFRGSRGAQLPTGVYKVVANTADAGRKARIEAIPGGIVKIRKSKHGHCYGMTLDPADQTKWVYDREASIHNLIRDHATYTAV